MKRGKGVYHETEDHAEVDDCLLGGMRHVKREDGKRAPAVAFS